MSKIKTLLEIVEKSIKTTKPEESKAVQTALRNAVISGTGDSRKRN